MNHADGTEHPDQGRRRIQFQRVRQAAFDLRPVVIELLAVLRDERVGFRTGIVDLERPHRVQDACREGVSRRHEPDVTQYPVHLSQRLVRQREVRFSREGVFEVRPDFLVALRGHAHPVEVVESLDVFVVGHHVASRLSRGAARAGRTGADALDT
jgi:hypothetical protein